VNIIPAIDLKDGKCVRLYQGDYSQETVFSEDPVGMAQHWFSLGAQRLHIVDLDGAAAGKLCHLDVVREIARATSIPVQVGGGIRRLEAIEKLLDSGVARVILGTAAVASPEMIEEACQRFGEAVIVGIDAREGYVAVQGWLTGTTIAVTDLLQRMAALGARRFIYTDILRDGTLSQPNFEAIEELTKTTSLPIIAAGGISSVSDLVRLGRIGVEGAIVGRALYTGDIELGEALAALQQGQ